MTIMNDTYGETVTILLEGLEDITSTVTAIMDNFEKWFEFEEERRVKAQIKHFHIRVFQLRPYKNPFIQKVRKSYTGIRGRASCKIIYTKCKKNRRT